MSRRRQPGPYAYWLAAPVYVGEEPAHAAYGPTPPPRRRGLRGLLGRLRRG